MESIKPLLILMIAVITSCANLIHNIKAPTQFYFYSEGKLQQAKDSNQIQFQKLKNETHFRQAGHITYDYFGIDDVLNLPKDSVQFKSIVNQIIRLRIQNFTIDSLQFYSSPTESQVDDYFNLRGKIFRTKSNSVYYRRFSASVYPKINSSIIKIETYVHLKF